MELFFALIVFCWIVCGLCWLFVKVGELLFGKFWERMDAKNKSGREEG